MSNTQNLKPFKKGFDPRRNLRGVPKDTLRGRALIRKIGAELLIIREMEGGQVTEYEVTRLEKMVRKMYESDTPAAWQTILKALWPGIVKDDIAVADDDKITVRLVQDPPLEFDYGKFILGAQKREETT